MRHSGWRRLRGDTDRPDLLDLGKKLLGYLDSQRRLSGVKTLSLQRRTSDGSVVRARWIGDQPQIDVWTPELEGEAPAEWVDLDGFILTPAEDYGDPPAPHSEILLQPVDHGDRWKRYFYDGALVPDPPHPVPTGTYGEKVYPEDVADGLPDGLTAAGCVDWRNADESLALAYAGPHSRYFGLLNNAHTYGRFIYCKGQLLLDVADVSGALFGRTGAVVLGACLRDMEGTLHLIFVAGFTSPAEEAVATVPLAPVAHLPGAPPARAAYYERITADADGLVLLHARRTRGTLSYFDHPWMFNQAGTEARCIRWRVGNPVRECVLSLPELDAVVFSETEIPLPETTITTATTARVGIHDYNPYLYPRVEQNGDGDGSDGGTLIKDAAPAGLAGTNISTLTNHGMAFTEIRAIDEPWLRAAVDYVDDVPVYADFRAFNSSEESASATRTHSHAATLAIENMTWDAVAEEWTYDATIAVQASSIVSGTRTKAGVTGGLRTPWMTVETTLNESGSAAGETSVNSSGALRQLIWTGLSDFSWSTSLRVYDAGLDDLPTMNAVHGRDDQSSAQTQTFYLGYLDLRHRWLVYGITTNTVTGSTTESLDAVVTNASGSAYLNPGGDGQSAGTVDNFQSPAAFDAAYAVANVPRTTGSTNRTTAQLFTTLDGVVLESGPEVEISASSSPGTSSVLFGSAGGIASHDDVLGSAFNQDTFSFPGYTVPTPTPLVMPTFDIADDAPTVGTTTPAMNQESLHSLLIGSSHLACEWAIPTGSVGTGPAMFGAWQTYRGRYAYSQAWPTEVADDPRWAHGLGANEAGRPIASSFTLPGVTSTGAPSVTHYHPISILPRVRVARRP